MKILIKIISVFLYFNSVSPVQMYYIYDDNPNIGFVSLDNGVETYMKPGFVAGKASKQHYTGGSYSNSKYMKSNSEHVIDSHFKVMKTPLRYTMPATVGTGRHRTHEAQRTAEEYKNTEAPQQQKTQLQQIPGQQDKQITQVSSKTTSRGDYGSKSKASTSYQSSNNKHVSPVMPKANTGYNNDMKQRNQESARNQRTQDAGYNQRNQDSGYNQRNQDAGYNQKNQDAAYSRKNQDAGYHQRNQDAGYNQRNQDTGYNQKNQDGRRNQMNKDGSFDIESTYLQSKVRKGQTSSGPLSSSTVHNNHQLSLSERRSRIPATMVIDKTLHKTTGIAYDHNKQVMARVLDDMTQKIADRRHKKGEYVTRDTDKHLDILYEKSKRSVVADNMRKYIGKDKIVKDLHNHGVSTALARIGSREDTLDLDETPYAVFYRMNPESLDQQEGYMIMKSKDDSVGGDIAFMGKTDMATTKTNGASYQRGKLKNFSHYRNH